MQASSGYLSWFPLAPISSEPSQTGLNVCKQERYLDSSKVPYEYEYEGLYFILFKV